MKKIALALAGLLFAGTAHADDTLFADMGGKDVITKVAYDTADNFIADPRIKDTFDNTNMDRFKVLLAETGIAGQQIPQARQRNIGIDLRQQREIVTAAPERRSGKRNERNGA